MFSNFTTQLLFFVEKNPLLEKKKKMSFRPQQTSGATTANPTPQYNNNNRTASANNTNYQVDAAPVAAAAAPAPNAGESCIVQDDNRLWAFFGLMAISTCCGIPAHVLKSNIASGAMWGTLPSSNLEIGLWSICNADGSTCSDFFNNDNSLIKINQCSSGFTSEQRWATFAGLAVVGVAMAFISCCVALLRGNVAWFARHFCSFVSFGTWTIVMIMFWVHDQYLVCTSGLDGKTYGLSFWLSLVCSVLGAAAWVLSISSHSYDACCRDPLKHKEMLATGQITVAADQQQQSTEMTRKENNLNYSAPEAAFQQHVAAQDDHSRAADARDPASVGLEDHWYFDDESGYWWSDQTQMYYDAATGAYGNPTDGTWFNAETGEWSKPE